MSTSTWIIIGVVVVFVGVEPRQLVHRIEVSRLQ